MAFLQSSSELFPAWRTRIKGSLVAGFGLLLDQKVVSSHAPLLLSSRLDKKLRIQLQEFLPEVFRSTLAPSAERVVIPITVPVDLPREDVDSSFDGATFSDEDHDDTRNRRGCSIFAIMRTLCTIMRTIWSLRTQKS